MLSDEKRAAPGSQIPPKEAATAENSADTVLVHCIEISDRHASRLQSFLQAEAAVDTTTGRSFSLPSNATVDTVKERILAGVNDSREESKADPRTLRDNKAYNKRILQVFAVRRPLLERLTTAVMDVDASDQALVERLGLDAQSGGEVVALPPSLPIAELLSSQQFVRCGSDAAPPSLALLYCYESSKMGMDCRTICGCCCAAACCAACVAACCYCCSGKGGNKEVVSNNPYPQKPNQNPYGGNQNAYGGNQNAYGGNQNAYGGNQIAYGGNQNAYDGNQNAYGGNQNPYNGNYQAL